MKPPLPLPSDDPRWVAVFDHGTVVVTGDTYRVYPLTRNDDTLSVLFESAVERGWPDLPGWSIDTRPGLDPEWMYLRLAALGAVDVTGPCPPCDRQSTESGDGVIVG